MAAFFQGLGSSGLKIDISLTDSSDRVANNNANGEEIFYLRHRPGWKVRKNVFSAALRKPSVTPTPIILSQQQQLSRGKGGYAEAPSMDLAPQLQSGKQGVPVYSSERDVEGVVRLHLPMGKKLDHLGIRVQFFGRIDLEPGAHEGRPNYDFISLSKELLPPGALYDSHPPVPFHFRGVEKIHESYHGRNVSVRYFVRVEVQRQWLPPVSKEHEVLVQIKSIEPAVNNPIKMEVGIEDCLHIEFEYERRCYHLQDVICGRINFLLVRIKIKHMELAVIRRETSGEGVAMAATSNSSGSRGGGGPAGGASSGNETHNILTETQTLLKYEIMDGAPVRGELIPVRLHLSGIPADLTPTYDAENNRFSVRYFLNLVLVDEEDRRYFKQQEIILWRKNLG